MTMAPDYPEVYFEYITTVDKCSECGDDIMEGEEYYDIDGQSICLDCMKYHKKTAKEEYLN